MNFEIFLPNMKKRILRILYTGIICSCICPVCSQDTKGIGTLPEQQYYQGNIHALIIGISDYAGYPDLQFADKDAVAFYNLLLSDAFGADSNRVVLLLNEQATQNRLDEALMNLVSFVREGDRVFIHFSGHGGVEGLTTTRRGFLLTHETSQSNLRLTSYRIEDLNAIIGELSTANKADVYLVVDACHAGKVEEGQFKGLSPVNEYIGRITYGTVFLSSSPDELSLEGSQWGGGRGLFSYHLVNGLAGKADMDGDGIVDLTEIEFYVKSKVNREAAPSHQNPVINGSYKSICRSDPAFLENIDHNLPLLAQMTMRDISPKGYEELFLDKLTDKQRLLYKLFVDALDKSLVPSESIGFVKYDAAQRHYSELVTTGIPEDFEVILRRKLIAALQDKPQQMLDSIMSDREVYSSEDKICLMADNLRLSADLIGESHYLYDITLAKHYYFKSYCFRFNDNYDDDPGLKMALLSAIDSAIMRADDISFFYQHKGNTLDDLGQYEEAVLMFDKALQLDPDDPDYYCSKGMTLTNLNQNEEAIRVFDIAIQLNPNNATYYSSKGIALDNMEQYEEALLVYDQAIALEPDVPGRYYNKGLTLTSLERFWEAMAMFDIAIALDPSDPDYYNSKGRALDELARYEEALTLFDMAIQLDEDNASFYCDKGITLANLGLYEEAIVMYDNAILLSPEKASYYSRKGIALDDLERYEEAIAVYDKAIELEPDDPNRYYNKALSLRNLDRYEEALGMYDKAISLNPEDADFFYSKASCLREMDRLEEALALFEKGIALWPEQVRFYARKAYCLMALNRFEESIQLFEQCLAMDSENQKSYFYDLGCVYSRMNDAANALLFLEKSLSAGYDDFDWISQDTDWDNVKDTSEFRKLIKKYSK